MHSLSAFNIHELLWSALELATRCFIFYGYILRTHEVTSSKMA